MTTVITHDLQLHLRYRNSIWNIKRNRNKILFMLENVFANIVSLQVLTPRWAKFSCQWNSLILLKMVWCKQADSEFQGLSRPNKEIKSFFKKELNWIQGLFKTTTKLCDLFKIVQTKLFWLQNEIPALIAM